MKKKTVILIFTITLLSTQLFSQSINEKINKQIRDPHTAENSAKADVYIQKKMIEDSLLINKNRQAISKKKNKKKKF